MESQVFYSAILVIFFSWTTCSVSLVLIAYLKAKPLGTQTFYDSVNLSMLRNLIQFSAAWGLIAFLGIGQFEMADELAVGLVLLQKYLYFAILTHLVVLQGVKWAYIDYPHVIDAYDEGHLLYAYDSLIMLISAVVCIIDSAFSSPPKSSSFFVFLQNVEDSVRIKGTFINHMDILRLNSQKDLEFSQSTRK